MADPPRPIQGLERSCTGPAQCQVRGLVAGCPDQGVENQIGKPAVLGLDRVLVPCLADNVASAGTIECNGGVVEVIREAGRGPVRRYWIALDP